MDSSHHISDSISYFLLFGAKLFLKYYIKMTKNIFCCIAKHACQNIAILINSSIVGNTMRLRNRAFTFTM